MAGLDPAMDPTRRGIQPTAASESAQLRELRAKHDAVIVQRADLSERLQEYIQIDQTPPCVRAHHWDSVLRSFTGDGTTVVWRVCRTCGTKESVL
jgi:hypothetical protein